MQMKIRSDKYKKFMKEHEEMMEGMPKGMGMMGECEYVPVDLYGKRVNLEKDDKSNFEKTAKDIQEFYGLENY